MTEGERIATKWKTLFAYNKTCAELAADIDAALASARPAMGDDVVRQALEFYANADYEGTGFWDGISCPGILFDKGRTAKAVLESSRPAMGDDVKLREALIQILDDGQFIVGYNDDDTPIFTTDEKRLTNGGSFCGGAGQQAISALATIPAGAPAPADEVMGDVSALQEVIRKAVWKHGLNGLEVAKAALAATGDDVVRILSRLVKLKEHKDKFGKDNFYIINQPQAWKDAEAVLAAIKSEKLHG